MSFSLGKYIGLYAPYPDVRFSVHTNWWWAELVVGYPLWSRQIVCCLWLGQALDASKPRRSCFSYDAAAYVEILSSICIQKNYAVRLALIVRNNSDFSDNATITYSLEHVASFHPPNALPPWIYAEHYRKRLNFRKGFLLGAVRHYLLNGRTWIFLELRPASARVFFVPVPS